MTLPERLDRIREVPFLMAIGMVILAILCLVIGILYPFYGHTLLEGAQDILVNPGQYLRYALP